MKLNNKGFTLIELIATVVLLGVIAGLTISTVMAIVNNAKNKTYQTTITNVEKIATSYLKENIADIDLVDSPTNEYQCIQVKHLIESGYFDRDILNSPINDDLYVGEEMYIFISRNKDTKVIDQTQLIYDINMNTFCEYINEKIEKEITIDYEEGWRQFKEVTITYKLHDAKPQKVKQFDYAYKVNDEELVRNTFENNPETKQITIHKPSNIIAKIYYKDEEETKTASISKIDNVSPIISSLPGDTNYTKTKNLTVTITDSETSTSGASGFNKSDANLKLQYGWSESNTTEPTSYTTAALTYSNCIENTECKTATFPVTGSGLTGEYYLWIKPTMADIAGNEVAGIVSSGTYKFDNLGPVILFTPNGNSTFEKEVTSVVTVTDLSGVVESKYIWSTSNIATASGGDTFTSGASLSKKGVTDIYYLCVYAKDAAGNTSNTCSNPFHLDNTSPIVTFTPNGNSTYEKEVSTVVTVEDVDGIAVAKYLWSTSNTASASSGTSFSSGERIPKNTGTGTYYLCVYAKDNNGNEVNECSNAFKLDNTAPTITTIGSNYCFQNNNNTNLTDYVTVTDNESGVNQSSITATLSGSTITNLNGKSPGTYTVTYNAKDKAGNSAASKTITFNIYTKIIGTQNIVTSGSGLYEDGGRYIFKGSSPNNYLSFNGQTWRILSIEADGTYKIVYDGIYTTAQYHNEKESGLETFNSTTVATGVLDPIYTNMSSSVKGNLVQYNHPHGTIGTNADSSTLGGLIGLEKYRPASRYIGLPTMSDYFLASSNCTTSTSFSTANTSYTCKNNNWMYLSSNYHVMQPYSYKRVRWFNPNTGGMSYLYSTDSRGIRPTAYLKNTTTFTGSGTSSNPYVINNNCEVAQTYQKSSKTCSITTSSAWETSKTLTISPSNSSGVTYSFDFINWSGTKTKTVSSSGQYIGYIKDSSGGTNSCSINIASRTEYRSRTCPNQNLKFTSWSNYGTVYNSTSCTEYSKASAENSYNTQYNTCPDQYKVNYVCNGSSGWGGIYNGYSTAQAACSDYRRTCGSDNFTCTLYPGATIYRRSASCTLNNGFADGTWSSWGTTVIEENSRTQVETRTTYGIG